jgi:hypothetical protein
MVGEIRRMYNDKAKQQIELNNFYSTLASDAGLEPDKVIGVLGTVNLEPEPLKPQQVGSTFLEKTLGKTASVGRGAIDTLLGSTKNIIQDVVQTAPAKARNKANDNLINQAVAISLQADKEKDPTKKKLLLQQANEILAGTSSEAGNIAGGFSQSVATNPALRGLSSGSELYSGAKLATAAPKIVAGAAKFARNPIQSLLGQSGEKLAEVSKATIEPKNLVAAAEKHLTSNPEAKQLYEVLKPTLENVKTPATLLQRMKFWGTAFKTAGDAKDTVRAQFLESLYQAAKKELQEKAPEIAKSRSVRNLFFYQGPRTFQKASTTALKVSGIGRLLGL